MNEDQNILKIFLIHKEKDIMKINYDEQTYLDMILI